MSYVDVTGLELKVTTNIGNSIETLDRLQKSLQGLNTLKLTDTANALKGLGNVTISKDIANVGKAIMNFNTALNAVDTKTLHNQANNLKKALTPLANILERISDSAKGLDFTGVAKAAQAINKAGLGTTTGGRRSASTAAPASTLAMRTGMTTVVSTPIEQAVRQTFSNTINNAIEQSLKTPLLPAQTQAGVAYAARDAVSARLNQVIAGATAQFSAGRATSGINASLANNMTSVIMGNMYRQIADSIAHSTVTPKLPAMTTSTVAAKVREDMARVFAPDNVPKLPAQSSASAMRTVELDKVGSSASAWSKISTAILNATTYLAGFVKGTREAGNEASKTESKFSQFVSGLTNVGMMQKQLEPMFNGIIKGISGVGSAFVKAGTAVASFARGPLSMVFNPFKNLASTLKDTTTRFVKFLSALKRVAIYRAIRAGLKAITQGIKEGIENLYQWSKITGGDFAAAMDQIATAALYVKNSLAAMVSPIITAVAPAIDMLADKFVALLNIMNQFFARITGRATWTEALKYPTEYAENTAGAAKKIKDNIQDFDELHILRTPNAGGSGDNLDYNNMFRESEFTNEFSDWVGEFKRALKNSQFYKAGTILGDALNDIFTNKIPWGDLGDTVGKKITDVFQFALGLLRTFSFTGMGADIATFLNHAIDNIDTHAVGSVFAYKIQSVIDLAWGFVTTADWDNYGKKVSDFVTGWFETIDGSKIGSTISAAIHGALTFIESFLEDDYKWDLIAEDIAGLINNIDWFGILSRTLKIGAKIFDAIIRVIRRAISGEQAEPVSEIFESTDMWRIDYLTRQANGTLNNATGGFGESLSNMISNSIGEIDFMDIAEPLYNLLKMAWEFAWDLIVHGGKSIGTKIIEDVEDVYRGGHWEEDGWQQASDRSFAKIFGEGSANLLETGGLTGLLPWMIESAQHPERIGDTSWLRGEYNVFGENTARRYAQNPLLNSEILRHSIFGGFGVENAYQAMRNNRLASIFLGVGGTNNLFGNLASLAGGRQGSNGNANSRRFAKAPNYDSSAKSMARFAEETKKQEYNLTELYKMSETSSAHMAEHWENSASKIEGRVTAKFASTKDQISATITGLTTESSEKFNTLGTTMSNSLSGVASAMVSPLNEIKGQITGAFSEAGEITKEDIGNLSDVMVSSLKGVYDASAPEVTKVNVLWSSLKDNMKTAGNGIIDIAEKVGNSIIDAFNAMGDNLKSYDGLTFPDGTRINLASVKRSPKLNIPRLATGGLVSSPTVAMVGEAGREAILPLDNNTGWMDEFAEKVGGGAEEIALLREQNELLRQIAAKKMGITPNEVFNAVREENRDYFVRTGSNALVM